MDGSECQLTRKAQITAASAALVAILDKPERVSLTCAGISKSKFVAGLQCVKRLYLQVHAPQLGKITDQGIKAQGKAVGVLARNLFRGGTLVEADRNHLAEAMRTTRELMNNPEIPAIFEATFRHDGVLVQVDVLSRIRKAKEFQLIEVKSSTEVKPYHVHDLGIQRYVLRGVGLCVKSNHLMHVNSDYVFSGHLDLSKLFRIEEIPSDRLLTRSGISQILNTQYALLSRPEPPLSARANGTVLRSVDELRKHPTYAELQLAVSPAQLAALKRLGDLAFKDPLLVTHEGLIIDGYARKEYADRLGIPALACVEFDIGEEEALRLILSKHRRCLGWNDFNRIRMASRLRDVVRTQARANQQAGGRFKGLSELTEANVRKEIAEAAGVSEGNVTKVDQLRNSDPEVLKALATGEIRIHRAWLWRALTPHEQREQLRLYQLNRRLKMRVKAKALAHRGNELSEITWVTASKVNAERILRKLSPITSIDSALPETITIGVLNIPGKAVFLSTELFERLSETEDTI